MVLLTGFSFLIEALPATAETAFDNPVADNALARTYGKFLAPGGVELAMSVQSDTAVNGQLVLRSVFTVDQGPGRLQVYAPPAGSNGPSAALQTGMGTTKSGSAQNQGLSVTIDRAGGTSFIQTGYAASSVTPDISIGTDSAGAASSSNNEGLTALPVASGAAGVQTGAGLVSVSSASNGTRVTLDGAGLSVSHLVGDATGAVIANTANNRSIDTVTTVQIDVHNAQSMMVGSSLLRLDALATAAARAMIR